MKPLLRTDARRRETKLKPHPRQQDIDESQPPVQTLKGRSNYNQYTEYMLSNGRKR